MSEAKSDQLKPGVEFIELPEEAQILAPVEANATLEYTEGDIDEDGIFKKGKFVLKSKDGDGRELGLTMEPTNFRLLVEPSIPTITSEGGVVKYFHDIVLTKEEPFAVIKNPKSTLIMNANISNPRI